MIFEYIPLLAFIGAYIYDGILTATAVLLVVSLVVVPIMWYKNGTPPMIHILTAVLVGVFGGLTLLSGDAMFIKVKPTIASLVLAGILVGMRFMGKDPLKSVMGTSIELPDTYWRILTYRVAGMFVLSAIANEIVWRNFTEETWVWFKVFGLMGMNIVFFLAHVPMIYKHGKIK